MPENNFSQDVEFLNQYVETIVLTNGQSKIAIVPEYQGRTMTSTSRGENGTSYGYINHDHISSGNHDPQINLYGGEDRMWISPEGGQYSVFFDPDVPLEYGNWRTPPVIDTAAFDIVEQSDRSVCFSKQAKMVNYCRFEFDLQMDRTVHLFDASQASERLGVALDNVDVVFHESQNKVTNIGDQPWRQETGLIGVWMLCMNKPSDQATLIAPFKPGSTEDLGTIVNADYFGKLDETRLVVDEAAGLIFFLGDGKMRSKLGLTFSRVTPRLGSWDKERGVLSVVEFNLPDTAPHGYTNNLWEIQDAPFEGDVINCYNDGPNETGGKLGGFFELETISPALALSPGESFNHVHSTIRMEGSRDALNAVAESTFGVGLDKIESCFG
jgi:hypothetical protein